MKTSKKQLSFLGCLAILSLMFVACDPGNDDTKVLTPAEKQQAYNIEQGRNMHSLLSKGLWIALLLVIGTFAVVVLAIYRGLNDVVYVALAASVIFVAIFVLRKFPKNKMI